MPTARDREWKQFYRDQYAQDWEQFSQTLASQEYHRRYQEACLQKIRNANPQNILEVGVGRGDLLVRLVGPNVELFGCDISTRNLSVAASRLKELGRPVTLTHADAEHLPFRDGSFDAVYAFSLLWYLPNPARAVAEMCRVTRPGGIIVFDMLNATHITSAAYHTARILARWLGRERGRTRLASPGIVRSWVAPFCTQVKVYGAYILLPAGLPLLGEMANMFRLVPDWAAVLADAPWRWLAQKLVVVAAVGATPRACRPESRGRARGPAPTNRTDAVSTRGSHAPNYNP